MMLPDDSVIFLATNPRAKKHTAARPRKAAHQSARKAAGARKAVRNGRAAGKAPDNPHARRHDPAPGADPRGYTKAQFVKVYRGTAQWDAAVPASACIR